MALTTEHIAGATPVPAGPSGGPVDRAPGALTEIAARVEDRLQRLLTEDLEWWSAVDADLAEPLRCLERLVLSGGKRLRAAFAHWGYRCAGGDPDREPGAAVVLDAGAALELLQAFALVHDDVMDDAATRRGRPTAHVEFAALATARGWRGEPRRIGESVAILLGDLAHVRADGLMASVPPAAAAVWHELSVEVMMGQYLDVMCSARGATTVQQSRRIARLKSGRYTIERPLQLGAALAGGSPALLGELSRYGAPLGEAFQLRDDVLGAFGEPAVTGKPVGDDLREGKPTALLALACERATAPQREVLRRVGEPDLAAGGVAAVQQVLADTGALAQIEADIERLTAEAVAAIAVAPVPDDAIAALGDLAGFVAVRSR